MKLNCGSVAVLPVLQGHVILFSRHFKRCGKSDAILNFRAESHTKSYLNFPPQKLYTLPYLRGTIRSNHIDEQS
jgi:hypothetical protein